MATRVVRRPTNVARTSPMRVQPPLGRPSARPTQPLAPSRGGGLNSRQFVVPTGDARADYDAASRVFGSNVILFPSTLRITSEVLGTQNSVVFDLENGIINADSPLNINDGFLAQHMGIFIARNTTAQTANGATLYSSPTPFVFTSVNELIAMPTLYNGNVAINVNDIQYGRSMDMLAFKHVDGEAQQGLAVSAVANVGLVPESSWNGNDAFLRLIPQMVFNGPNRNIVTVNLPASVNLAAAAGSENRLTLIFRGLLAQNGGRMRAR